jgi:hypothetical protein
MSNVLVDAITALYSEQEMAEFEPLLAEFVTTNFNVLQHIYETYTPDFSPLAYQPEALAIWERIDRGAFDLDAVAQLLPVSMIEELANMWGTTILEDD